MFCSSASVLDEDARHVFINVTYLPLLSTINSSFENVRDTLANEQN